ncbi:hypothetical protein D4764_0157030, partial [Takifugu flavidus]
MKGAQRGSLEVTLDRDLCVLRGASAVINCRYSKPLTNTVTAVGWRKQYQERYRYLGDFISDCRLQINDVQHADAGDYFFSFLARFEDQTSKTSTKLYVKELTAAVQPSSVAEGDVIRLTCVSGCPTPVDTVWFKDGQPVRNEVIVARREDTGRYHCAVRGQEWVRSAPVAVNVLYPPDRVTLTISSPGNVVRGSSVNLTCSSDANPPADTYIWYRNTNSSSSNGSQVGSGQEPSGGKNSTEVLLAMVDEEQRGSQTLPAVVGIGLALIVALVVALFLFWWKKRRLHQKALVESNVIYSNIQRPDSALPDVARHTISSSQSPASMRSEVIYSLVNIKSRDLEGLRQSRCAGLT